MTSGYTANSRVESLWGKLAKPMRRNGIMQKKGMQKCTGKDRSQSEGELEDVWWCSISFLYGRLPFHPDVVSGQWNMVTI